MCFLKECLCPVGVYQKRSDAVVRANQSICFPQGMLQIVYSATFISQLLFIHQTCTFSPLVFTTRPHANVRKQKASGWISPPCIPSICDVTHHLLPNASFLIHTFCPSSSSPAHQSPRCSSERCSGPPCFAVVGAGKRRPVPSALLHCAAPRASREQLDGPLCLRQPRGHLLHSFQVESSYQRVVNSHFHPFYSNKWSSFCKWNNSILRYI